MKRKTTWNENKEKKSTTISASLLSTENNPELDRGLPAGLTVSRRAVVQLSRWNRKKGDKFKCMNIDVYIYRNMHKDIAKEIRSET